MPGLPLLVAAIEHANARVHAAAYADRQMAGMGATFTGLLVLQDRAVIGHVGDSRAYRLRGRRLDQLTDDHTLVGEYVRAGMMTAGQAAISDRKHVLSRAVGPDPTVTVDQRQVAIERGDTFLLATDGLHGVIGDAEIAMILRSECDLTRSAARLIEAALDSGAPDNVTVVLARIV